MVIQPYPIYCLLYPCSSTITYGNLQLHNVAKEIIKLRFVQDFLEPEHPIKQIEPFDCFNPPHKTLHYCKTSIEDEVKPRRSHFEMSVFFQI